MIYFIEWATNTRVVSPAPGSPLAHSLNIEEPSIIQEKPSRALPHTNQKCVNYSKLIGPYKGCWFCLYFILPVPCIGRLPAVSFLWSFICSSGFWSIGHLYSACSPITEKHKGRSVKCYSLESSSAISSRHWLYFKCTVFRDSLKIRNNYYHKKVI